ncbi:Molybdopterin biosynthesis protein [Phytophthora fragariae]|nr:Molybdopterin biosynthesis protein [Phytophthora fragariae]KAE8933577.1 Molybdopterin biosynthesis protein [Phytophthora fragariae]KAE9101185.1 Molybdopterin biosynthesis protein [Phytophthora fragariae]KAE9103384.1 Molybdopterin biosynthesis protein [Phytophthora fragariae]KAE9138246.1 Molybdopterin biosynthesis protein [Phytophthora fragariae]
MCDCECGDEGVSPTRRESAYDMLRVEAAVELVLQQAQPLGAARVPAHEADGFVLAEPVHSVEPLPPFRASIMDGYAVVAADGVGTFPVVERIAAGDLPVTALTPGQVSYITTGSPVPDGADAVVKVEDTSSVDGSETVEKELEVKILKAVKAGQNIRAIGSDISPGQVLVDARELVSAAEIGLLATAGITEVVAHRKPVVGVLSTGSELVEAFQGTTTPGKIRDSNRPMLLALIGGWGAKTLNLGVCGDRKQALKDTIVKALEQVDVLITSGGVSMGDHDLIKPLLEEMGTVHFGRLLMKPGKPTTFATLDVQGTKKLVFALPGNPVSSFTTCHLLVLPALRRLRGLPISKCHHAKVYATLTHPIKLDPERPEFHRANLEWDGKQHRFLATSTGRQISSRLLSCRNANALLCLPTGTEIRGGDAVPALVLDNTFGNAASAAPTLPTQSTVTKSSHQHVKDQPNAPKKIFRAGLLTISDRVSAGTSTDMSGPAMADVLHQVDKVKMDVVVTKVVPDDVNEIQAVVKDWADSDVVDLILTSGGTGFSPRDVTPEAIKPVLDKEIPGFPIAMLESSLKITAKAVLSRPVAGIRKNTLIVTLPGKPKAVVENFSAIAEVLPHALHLVRDVPHEHHRANPSSRYT